MHKFVVHSNYSVCRKSGRLGLDQVRCRARFPWCIPVFNVKGGGRNRFPFHPHDALFGFLQLFSGGNERLIELTVGNCSYYYISTYLSCGSKGYPLVGSNSIFHLGMCQYLIVYGVNILTCYCAACLHGRQTGTFI